MGDLLQRFRTDESGATAVEYGIILALITVVCISTFKTLGISMNAKFLSVTSGL